MNNEDKEFENTEELNDDIEILEENNESNNVSCNQKIKKLQEKIKNLEKEKQEYLDGWQRARADYANLQKSHEDDKKRLKDFFKENFIADFIPVIDSFQMAMSNKSAWESVDLSWRTGVEYIYQQFINALEDHGLKIFGEVGDEFDPAKFEAVESEMTEEQSKDHTVAKVVQKGFSVGENVIRSARVVVYQLKK